MLNSCTPDAGRYSYAGLPSGWGTSLPQSSSLSRFGGAHGFRDQQKKSITSQKITVLPMIKKKKKKKKTQANDKAKQKPGFVFKNESLTSVDQYFDGFCAK